MSILSSRPRLHFMAPLAIAGGAPNGKPLQELTCHPIRLTGPLVLPLLSHVKLSKNYRKRLPAESGCKGSNFIRNSQTFTRLFYGKAQDFRVSWQNNGIKRILTPKTSEKAQKGRTNGTKRGTAHPYHMGKHTRGESPSGRDKCPNTWERVP